jgi:hypothetical protein
VMIKCALILWAIEHLYVIKFELPRHILLELALVAAVRALDQAAPLSLPVGLDIKNFRPGLRDLKVIALLGRITTALTGLHPSRSGRARQRTRTCNRFSGPKTRFKACHRDLVFCPILPVISIP